MPGGSCSFGVLGPLVLERDGHPIALPSGRQRSLLALLLLAGGVPLSRDRLIDELWGEQPPASAVSALHVHLSKLRGLLEGLLVLEPAGYSLQAGEFDLDVWRFDALVEQARAEPENAVAVLMEALALFRGEPLCDVAAEGSIGRWRRSLDEKHLQARILRVDAELSAGRAGELVGQLERLVDEHPYEEQLWGQLMLAQYRAGRQAEALETFQRVRRLLSSELGLDPGEPLARLQRQILDRDAALAPREPSPPAATQPAAPAPAAPSEPMSHIPLPPTRLVGREEDLAALTGLMADPDVRLITVTGAGGVGKTRLLVELARLQETHYGDGAAFVRLERLTDPALVAAEIASTLAQRDEADGPGADGLISFLHRRELLLVIDNFEHLLDASVLLSELLSGAPGLRVVVSSRTALRLRGEQVFEVEPLALPVGDTAEEVSQSPAVQLFLQSALAANRRFPVDASTNLTVARICRALDGLPLGIELAAARAQSLTAEEIAQQLEHPLLIGGRALRDLPDRQQTLQATIRWSYDLLDADARGLLCCAGVFLGGFTLPALDVVAGQPVTAALDELLDANLIRRGDVGRFELLELVRAFALEELQATGGMEEARALHRRYFVQFVAESTERFDAGTAPGELVGALQADHANIRSALENALDAGERDEAVALALGLRPLWLAGMLRQESNELVERLVSEFSLEGSQEIALLRAVSFLEGFGERTPRWLGQLARRAAELGDNETLATATGNLFARALNRRDPEEMARIRPLLLALVTPETSPRAAGWTHYFLSLDAYVDGRLEEACEHATQSAKSAREIGHDFMLGSAVGTGLLARSALEEVIRQPDLAEAVEIMSKPTIAPMAVFALWLVARYAAGAAPEDARRWLALAEQIAEATDSQLWPEGTLRDEALVVLGIDDMAPLLENTPPVDHGTALIEAVAWVSGRDPSEQAPRQRVPVVV